MCIIEHFDNADAVPQPPERCLSRQAGIVRYCLYGKELPAMAIKRVFQKEPVLSIAACLALVSSCFVLPDAEYLGYIDFRTLAILFSLMTVMAGLRGQGVFDRLGRALLSHANHSASAVYNFGISCITPVIRLPYMQQGLP